MIARRVSLDWAETPSYASKIKAAGYVWPDPWLMKRTASNTIALVSMSGWGL